MKNIASNRSVRLILTLLFCCVLPVAMFAQSAGSGSITGTLVDTSGAVIPGANVTVHNVNTGIKQTVVSNGAGSYLAPFLQPGNYEIAINKQGFAKTNRTGIVVEVGRTVTLNLTLAVSSAAETVNVTGESPALDLAKVEVSQDVSQNSIENLPLIGRRWDNFVLTTPATTTDGGLVSYRGVSGLYNLNMVDGANNNQAFFSEARGRSTAPYTYGMDTIEQFQVNTSNYSAEFGQAAGGIINAVTKSGTNTQHGDLFYYLRYPSMNALDPYNKSQGIKSQAVHQQQQFGGSVGGPIIKDKLFYFLGYDGYRKSFPITYTSYNATPTTFGLACPTQLSSTQCSEVQKYVEGNLGAYGRLGQQDLAFAKLDYQVNTRNRVSVNFNWDNYQAPDGYSSGTSYANSSVSANGGIVVHTRFLVANWSSTLSNSLVNNLRFQWARDLETAGANSGGPSVSVASVTGYGMPNALPRPAFPDEHRLQFSDTLSQSFGHHQLKYGLDVNFIHELLINLYEGGGLYSYTGTAQAAFTNWALDVFGVNAGDSLTGRHWNTFAQVTDPITHVGKDDFYNNDLALFAEDSWKLRKNLTVNIGIRYDLQDVLQPSRPNTYDALTTKYTTKINIPKAQFSPRLGFSWEAAKDTVVRGGFGMFYAKTSNSTFYAIRVENGVYQQTFNCKPTTCPALSFPNVIFTPPGQTPTAPFTGALTPTVTSFTPPAGTQLAHGLDPNFVNPVVYESHLAIERRLPGNVILTIDGLNSRGQHLPVFVDANLVPATTTRTFDIVTGAVAGTPATYITSVTVPYYTTRIDPTMGVVLVGKSTVKSWYNALVVSARKPLSAGLEVQLNYTYGKSLDQGAVAGQYGTFYGTDSPIDPNNQKAEKGPSDIDQRQRFSGLILYRPTFTKKISNPTLRYIADGFLFSTNLTFATGQPVSAMLSGTIPGVDGGVTGAEVSNAGVPTAGRVPQLMRNLYNLPSMYQVDFRVSRDFPITEKVRMQVLGEAFNLFNHTNVFGENTTAYYFDAVNTSTSTTTANYCPSTFANGTAGCLSPNTGTGSNAFRATNSTSSTNGLYTARQLQFSAKIIF
jgi:hypothetical protein